MGWVAYCVQHGLNFKGRANRAEFWTWTLLVTFIEFLIVIFVPSDYVRLCAMLVGLITLLPQLAVTVRRLHDTSRSAWWLGAYYFLYLGALGMALITLAKADVLTHPGLRALYLSSHWPIFLLAVPSMLYAWGFVALMLQRGDDGTNVYGTIAPLSADHPPSRASRGPLPKPDLDEPDPMYFGKALAATVLLAPTVILLVVCPVSGLAAIRVSWCWVVFAATLILLPLSVYAIAKILR